MQNFPGQPVPVPHHYSTAVYVGVDNLANYGGNTQNSFVWSVFPYVVFCPFRAESKTLLESFKLHLFPRMETMECHICHLSKGDNFLFFPKKSFLELPEYRKFFMPYSHDCTSPD